MNFDKEVNRKGTFCTQWDYVSDRFGKSDLLPFTISDTDFEVPKEINHALQKRMEHPVYGYTRWNHDEFKLSVKNWFKEKHQTQIDTASIVYTPSVMYGIAKLIQLLSNEGDGVVMQTPAYDAFFKTVNESKRQLIENPLIYKDNKYSIDFNHLEKILAEEKNTILLLCSPHNPTGRVWTKEELTKIVQLCEKYKVSIISDEIHMDVVHEQHQHIPLVNFDYEHIYIATSGTKTFNFPGLIFSYMIIRDPIILEKYLTILKNQDGLSSPSILGMIATMTAYNECGDWVIELNDYIKKNITLVHEYIKTHTPTIEIVPTEASYLMWLDISNTGFSQEEIQERFIDIGNVAIMNGSVYGGNGKQFIRLNVGCSRNKLIQGLEGINKAIN